MKTTSLFLLALICAATAADDSKGVETQPPQLQTQQLSQEIKTLKEQMEKATAKTIALPPGGLVYPITTVKDKVFGAEIRVIPPIKSVGKLSTWKPEVLAVSLNNTTYPELAAAAGATFAEDLPGPRLQISFNNISAEQFPAGTYSVTVKVTPPEALPEPYTMSVMLLRPVPTLLPPTTYSAEQEIDFFGEPENKCPALIVRETQGKAGIASLNVVDISQGGNYKTQTDAFLKLKDSPPAVPVRGSARIPIIIDKAKQFPLGDTPGKLSLEAPELPSPIEVSYTVHARRPRYHIIGWGVAGLLAGFLLRILPKRKLAQLAAEDAIDETLSRLADAEKGYQDPELEKELKQKQTKLENAKTTAPAIALKTNEQISGELATLLTTHQQNLLAVRNDFDALRQMVNRLWHLPKTLNELLKDSADFNGVERRLAAGDVTHSKKEMGDVRNKLSQLGPPGRAWRTQLDDFLKELSNPSAPLPARTATELSAWTSAFAAENPVGNLTDPAPSEGNYATLETFLLAVHRAYENSDALLQRLVTYLKTDFGDVRQRLAKISDPNAQTIADALDTAVNNLVETLSKAPQSPAEAQEILPAQLAAITDLIRRLPSLAGADRQAQVEEKIKSRDYVSAVELLKPAEVLYGDGQPSAAPKKIELSGWKNDPSKRATANPSPTPIIPDIDASSILARRLRTQHTIDWLNRLGTLVSAVVVLTVLYFNLYDTFIGTTKEVVGIVLGAFLFDLGVNFGINQVLQPLKFKDLSA